MWGDVLVEKIATCSNSGDMMTKSLSSLKFNGLDLVGITSGCLTTKAGEATPI